MCERAPQCVRELELAGVAISTNVPFPFTSVYLFGGVRNLIGEVGGRGCESYKK